MDFDLSGEGEALLTTITNTGQRYPVGSTYPLFFPETGGEIPAVALDHGLAALFGRAAWYRLVDASEERDGVQGIASSGIFFPLTR